MLTINLKASFCLYHFYLFFYCIIKFDSFEISNTIVFERNPMFRILFHLLLIWLAAILLIQLLADSESQAMALTVTYIHGESCDPRVQSELIPFEQQHDKFWFCDRQQKILLLGQCPEAKTFDNIQRRCVAVDEIKGEEHGIVQPKMEAEKEEFIKENQWHVEEDEEIEQFFRQDATPSPTSPVPSASVPPPLIVFPQQQKGQTTQKQELPPNSQLLKMAMNDSTTGERAPKTLKYSAVKPKTMEKIEDSKVGMSVTKVKVSLPPIKSKVPVESADNKQSNSAANAESIQNHRQTNPAANQKVQTTMTTTTLSTSKEADGENGQNSGRLVEIERARNIVYRAAMCLEGPPLLDNDGLVHACLLDFGHNPLSHLSCPLAYQCEAIEGIHFGQCCPKRLEKMAFEKKKLAVPSADFLDSIGDGDGGQQIWDYEDSQQQQEMEGHWDEELLQQRPPLPRQICPNGHSAKLHPLLGQPTICSPQWPASSCPPFSRCLYSGELLQFICCQPDDLRSAIRDVLAIGGQLGKQNTGKSGNWRGIEAMGLPQIGILPGQPGCLSSGQCQLQSPGARCVNWVCKCPPPMVVHEGRCVFRCPRGHSIRDGICTPPIPLESERFWRR